MDCWNGSGRQFLRVYHGYPESRHKIAQANGIAVNNPEADRRELIARLTETVMNYRKHRFVPVPLIRQEFIDMAFEAMANAGAFNRAWPQMRIEPIPE